MEALSQELKAELRVISGNEKQDKSYFLHPVVDTLMIGGLALIFYVAMHLMVEPNANTSRLAWIMFYASFAINFPHFMASYVLLYGDHRAKIFSNNRFFWAAVIVPILLIASFAILSFV